MYNKQKNKHGEHLIAEYIMKNEYYKQKSQLRRTIQPTRRTNNLVL